MNPSGATPTGGLAARPQAGSDLGASKDFQALVDRFQKETGRTTTGIVPVRVRLPEFGPSIFLAAELTAETRPPSLELAYKRAK
jgi:hypothetical protein